MTDHCDTCLCCYCCQWCERGHPSPCPRGCNAGHLLPFTFLAPPVRGRYDEFSGLWVPLPST